jgi:hypothetical protein
VEQLSSGSQPPGYPRWLVDNAARVKAVMQMLIGVYAIGWLAWAFLLSHKLGSCVSATASTREQFCYFIPPAKLVFQVIADALAAATVVQLAFTLFTPGPDEALDPVLLAIATALLFQLGKVDHFRWQDGLAVLLYGAALAGLFAVRVFIAPDEDSPPRLWWWAQRRPHQRPDTPGQPADPPALVIHAGGAKESNDT